jgi:hypothetical protein
MTRQKTISDKLFGTLTHSAGDGWKRPIELTIFNRLCTGYLIVLIDPNSGIEQNRLVAYEAFHAQINDVIGATEKAILDYYQSICIEYRERRGIVDSDDSSMPIIASIQDVSRLVKFEGVFFPYARPRPILGMLFKCTWEEEHGLAVKFENGQVTDVGFQDIVL